MEQLKTVDQCVGLPAASPGAVARVAGGTAAPSPNRDCFCTGLDDAGLSAALASPDLEALVRSRCPHAFAARPVFVPGAQLDRMAAVVRAVEAVVALPAYRAQVLAAAPAMAQHSPGGARSVLFGYDFHLASGPEGDRLALIEVNTNAGGVMLNAVAARAQRACCPAVLSVLPAPSADRLEADLVAMFQAEWRLSPLSQPRGPSAAPRPLRRVAIVDTDPTRQYLYPEFLLFQRLLGQHGITAVVCDPADLRFDGGHLRVVGVADGAAGGQPIDLVYNRLTDFKLADPASAALRDAALAGAVVLTPHPQAHALYADKRNLAVLSDDARLQALGLPAAERALLAQTVPRTREVRPEDAEALWADRRHLFFKPTSGFGSRAAYRGDKLTRGVWAQVLAGSYVAQELVAPGERVVDGAAALQPLKFDLRAYTYNGQVLWVAARLYQGQTTNFRTPGGGFAPVYRVG